MWGVAPVRPRIGPNFSWGRHFSRLGELYAGEQKRDLRQRHITPANYRTLSTLCCRSQAGTPPGSRLRGYLAGGIFEPSIHQAQKGASPGRPLNAPLSRTLTNLDRQVGREQQFTRLRLVITTAVIPVKSPILFLTMTESAQGEKYAVRAAAANIV